MVCIRTGVDVFSHFLFPFAAALAALGLWRKTPQDPQKQVQWRSRLAIAITFGAAATAPDLDGLYAWVKHTNGLYWLQHRGFSHSLIGAILHGLAGAGLVALVARLFPKRLGWLHWRAAYIPTAALGGLAHVMMDAFTYGGVPLWWPITDDRFSLNLYPWLLIWMAPAAGIVTVLFAFGKLSPQRVVQLTAVFLVVMLINAGLRLQERPPLAEDEEAFPRYTYREWIVLTPDPDEEGAWYVQIHRDGVPQEPQWHNRSHIEPGTERELERAWDTNAYKGFMMNVFGPVVTQTRSMEHGSVNVTFTAIVPRIDALNDPPWTPTHPDVHLWGWLILHVHEDRVETIQHGW